MGKQNCLILNTQLKKTQTIKTNKIQYSSIQYCSYCSSCLWCGLGQSTSSTSWAMSSLAKRWGKYRPLLVLLLLFLLHLLTSMAALPLSPPVSSPPLFSQISSLALPPLSPTPLPLISLSDIFLHRCVHQRTNLTCTYGLQALISVCSDWLHVSSYVHSEFKWLLIECGVSVSVFSHQNNTVSVLNDVSNAEKCALCFAKSVRLRMCV